MKPNIICLVKILPNHLVLPATKLNMKFMVIIPTLTTPKRGELHFLNNMLVSSLNEYLSYDEFDESLWVKIKLISRGNTLLLGCFYRSPNSDDMANNRFIKLLKKASEQHTSHLLIVGDFSCKDINWDALSTVATETSFQSRLLDLTCAQG